MVMCRRSALWGALGGLCATVVTWGSLHFYDQTNSSKQQIVSDLLYPDESQPLFVVKGEKILAAKLPDPLRKQFDKALSSRTQVRRDADLQFYKEVDKLARLYVLEKSVAAQASSTKKTAQEIEDEILEREEAGFDEARALYEASDPSAPREGFMPVRQQLVGYLNEVRRRESLEKWSNALKAKGEWNISLPRPQTTLNTAEMNLEGLPHDGRGTPNLVVFVDYLCEECVPFLVDLAQRLETHRNALRPVFVPFPYTQPEVSMALARGALCATQLDEFNAFHMAALTKGDLLSEVSVFDLARQTEMKMSEFRACWRSGEGLAELLARAQGLARMTGLMQTPAVVFNGQLFEGPKVLKELDQALASSSQAGKLTKRESENKSR